MNGGERIPLKIRERKRRSLDERLWVFAPRLLRRASRATFARKPGSRIRRALLKRSIQLSYEAQNRGDLEYTLILYSDECRLFNLPIEGGGERVAVVQNEYAGREGARQLLADWHEPWDEILFEPKLMFDLGDDRLLVLSDIVAKTGAGLELRERISQLIEFRGGMVTRHSNWLGAWRDGLRAAGMSAEAGGAELQALRAG